MRSLNEHDFTHQYVMRLFREMKYEKVRYNGGPNEYGKDVLCYETDNAGTRINVGIQVKVKRLGGRPMARTVIEQIQEAFEHPFIDPQDQTVRYIEKFYVITSKDITDPFINRVKEGTKFPVIFWDGRELYEKINAQVSTFMEYSQVEILLNEKSFTDLLQDNSWLEIVDEMMILLFSDVDSSPLQCINNLPNMLGAERNVVSKLNELDSVTKKSLLHWVSVELVLKAYFVMARTSKFTLFTGVSS